MHGLPYSFWREMEPPSFEVIECALSGSRGLLTLNTGQIPPVLWTRLPCQGT